MALHRVGRKIGEVHLVFTAVVFDDEILAIEACVDTKPDFTIVAGDRAVVLPPTLVGRPRRIVDQVAAIEIPDIGGTKVKPLIKFGLVVAANRELHPRRVTAIDTFDIATVELTGNDHLFFPIYYLLRFHCIKPV